MGIKAAGVKLGAPSRPGVLCRIDNPYSHLAASIIIQAFEDLRALEGDKKKAHRFRICLGNRNHEISAF